MGSIANSGPRTYNSDLRAAQSAATRERILDALVEVMAEDPTTISMPEVAERAGVSVGTIYRHFGDKPGLISALHPHISKRIGLSGQEPVETLDEVDEQVRRLFQHLDSGDVLLRAALVSGVAAEGRKDSVRSRIEILKESLERIDPSLSPDVVEHIARISLILTTSDSFRQWRDRLELTAEEAADEVVWAIRTLLQGAKERA